MAINLLGLLKDQMTDGVLEKMAGLAGESKSATSTAMDSILPTILGSVVQQGSTSTGAGKLLDMLKSGGHDGGMLDNLGSLLGGGTASSGLMDTGKSLLSTLMGSRQNGVMDLLGKVTGLSRGSNGSLMSMAAPMIMGLVGKHVKNKALDAVGLGSFLGGQRNGVLSALPSGMSNLLGFADDRKGATASTKTSTASTTPTRETTTRTPEPSGGGGGWIKWIVMGLIGLGVASYFFSGMGGATEKAGDMVNSATGAVKSGADGAMNAGTKVMEGAGNAAGAATNAAGNVVAGAKDAAGNAMSGAKDAAGNAMSGAKDAAGNAMSGAKDAAGNVIAGAKNAAGSTAGAAKSIGGYTIDGDGNLVGPAGNILSKAGQFEKSEDGYYVDKSGKKIGKWLKGAKDKVVGAAEKAGDAVGGAANKAGAAVAGAAGKTADAMKSTFSKMFKKEAGAESTYSLSQIEWDPKGHKIKKYSMAEVEGLAAALKANPDSKIKVEVGAEKMLNAKARANVVQNMLVALGVGKGQISSKGIKGGEGVKIVVD